MIRRAHDSFFFHLLDDAGGAVVADLQMALNEAGRGLALLADEPDRAVEQLVARAALDAGSQIGRAHARTPATNAHLVYRLLRENKKHNKLLTVPQSTKH